MAIQVQGFGGVAADVGGTGFRALKVEQRPVEYGALGSYRKSLISGTMAAALAANSEIYQFRWTDATRLCIIQKVVLDGFGAGTAFTAGFANIQMLPSRSWTVAGSGGTAGTLTGNNGKTRTSMGTTLVGDIRIASTAALTAGTKTNDTDPIGQYTFAVNATANAQFAANVTLFGEDIGPTHPLILAQNEGFILRATVPATGTWQFGVTTIWTEVTAY